MNSSIDFQIQASGYLVFATSAWR